MDVQGSQFHLIHGLGDWGRCSDGVTGQPLAAIWAGGGGQPAVAGPQLPGVRPGPRRAPAPARPAALPPGGAHGAARPGGPARGRARRLRQLVLDRRGPDQHPLAAGGRRRLGALVVGGPAQRVVRRRRAVGLRLVPAATAGHPDAGRPGRDHPSLPGRGVRGRCRAGPAALRSAGRRCADAPPLAGPLLSLRPGRHARRRAARPRPPERRLFRARRAFPSPWPGQHDRRALPPGRRRSAGALHRPGLPRGRLPLRRVPAGPDRRDQHRAGAKRRNGPHPRLGPGPRLLGRAPLRRGRPPLVGLPGRRHRGHRPRRPDQHAAAVLAPRSRLRLPGRPAGHRAAPPADALHRRRRGRAGGRLQPGRRQRCAGAPARLPAAAALGRQGPGAGG